MGFFLIKKHKFLHYLEIEHISQSILITGCVGAVSWLWLIKTSMIQQSWKKNWDVKILHKYFQNMRNTETDSAVVLWKSWRRKAMLKIMSLGVPFLFSSKQHRERPWCIICFPAFSGYWRGSTIDTVLISIYFQGLRDDVRTSGRAARSNNWIVKSACPHSTYCLWVYRTMDCLFQEQECVFVCLCTCVFVVLWV